jgi:glycosyltransferase involved in cell wall biosynthesis
VHDGVTGLLVPPGQPPALAAAIVRLLTDARARDEMSAAAARIPSTELSWDTIAERTEQVYCEALRSRPTRSAA